MPTLRIALVLTTLACSVGCTSSPTCLAIPDGVYTAIGPEGGVIIAPVDAGGTDGDAGDAGPGEAGVVGQPVTYTFAGGLPTPYGPPGPYNPWTCTKPTATCEMSYVCTQGSDTVGIVTSFYGNNLSFTITPPGAIVTLQPH